MRAHHGKRPGLCGGAVAMALAIAACHGDKATSGQEEKAMPSRPIETVLLEHTGELMSIEGVVGVYQGESKDGKPFIGVMVVERTHELEEKIPDRLEGYEVEIDETGEIRPMTGKP